MKSNTGNIYYHQEQSLPISLFKKVRGLCFVLILLVFSTNLSGNRVFAQDTTAKITNITPDKTLVNHSPRKALIYSLVLPGLGQAYNHKYWKLPIVYAGFGSMIYFIHTNTQYYHDYRDAYNYVSVTMKTVYPPTLVNAFPYPAPPNSYATEISEDNLKQYQDYYRRNLEVSYIFTGVLYILTAVDAVVDAHFFDYDINDDLSLKVTPWMPTMGTNTALGISGGINLNLRF